ncbi:MAG: Sarcosine oxidase subunit beta [Frankiales bacterium]|nr:Sarcosine oxidase subunit beta [Frankiales bacterium]
MTLQDVRIAVIGAGVSGLATASELLAHGASDVVVLEASHPGSGSSGRSVGMVETQYVAAPDIEVRAFGRRYYDAVERDHGLSFVHGGYLRLASSAQDLESYALSVQRQQDAGVTDAVVLSPEEIVARWPHLVVADRVGGLYGPSDGYIDGHEFCTLATRLVKERGGQVLLNSRVTQAEQKAEGSWLLHTPTGTVEADIVVNAGGPWAGVVGDLLGCPVPLEPQLHGALTVELGRPIAEPLPFVMDYVPGSGQTGVYFRSERPDQLIAGLHTEEPIFDAVSPDIALGRVSEAFVDELSGLLADRLNDCDDAGIGRSWTGIYPMTPDQRPIVGVHPSARTVICALGTGGNGIQLAPAVGRMAAEAALGISDRTFSDAVDWSPNRFAAARTERV